MQNTVEYNAQNYKFVAVVNKEISHAGVAMNALAHMTAGIVASADDATRESMSFINLFDKEGIIHPSVSALSLIVLRGTSNEIGNLKEDAISQKIHYVNFLQSMTGDTYKEQIVRTSNLSKNELFYYGIIMFGEKSKLTPMTKKFSLWR